MTRITAIALVALLPGCDQLFGFETITGSDARDDDVPLDAAEPCPLVDDFDDESLRDTWTVADPNHTFVVVSELGGVLRMAPKPGVDGYNSVTAGTFDLRGGRVQVELQPAAVDGFIESILAVSVDANNQLAMVVGALNLTTRVVTNGVAGTTSIAYGEPAHRHWQIRHDANLGLLYFQVSADATAWVTVAEPLAIELDLAAVSVQLATGSYQGGRAVPGVARWENFVLCTNPGD